MTTGTTRKVHDTPGVSPIAKREKLKTDRRHVSLRHVRIIAEKPERVELIGVIVDGRIQVDGCSDSLDDCSLRDADTMGEGEILEGQPLSGHWSVLYQYISGTGCEYIFTGSQGG